MKQATVKYLNGDFRLLTGFPTCGKFKGMYTLRIQMRFKYFIMFKKWITIKEYPGARATQAKKLYNLIICGYNTFNA